MPKTKPPSLVSVLILTLITVIMWVTFDVYRLFNKPVTPSVPENVSRQIDPTLDQSAIDQLESRIFLDDSQIPDTVISKSTDQELIFTPSGVKEVASPSGTIQNTENASGSGTPI